MEIFWDWTVEPVRSYFGKKGNENTVSVDGKKSDVRDKSQDYQRSCSYHAETSRASAANFFGGDIAIDSVLNGVRSFGATDLQDDDDDVYDSSEEIDEEEEEMIECLPGIEIIAKLCEVIAVSSQHLAMGQYKAVAMRRENTRIKTGITDAEASPNKSTAKLLDRMHELIHLDPSNVTYRGIKSALVKEFGEEEFEKHKRTVRWDLEHLAVAVTTSVPKETGLAQKLASSTKLPHRSMHEHPRHIAQKIRA